MKVNLFLDVKKLGISFRNLISIAYEIIFQISEGFRRDQNPFQETFDAFIAPNNTAYYLFSVIQLLTGKPIFAVDGLGPIPILLSGESVLLRRIKGSRVILLEEVIGTGSEIDRSLLFLSGLGINVVKIYGLYNLGIGRTMLTEDIELISMCTPKEELKYVYRS